MSVRVFIFFKLVGIAGFFGEMFSASELYSAECDKA